MSDLLLLPMTLYLLGAAIYVASILNGRQSGTLPKRRWIAWMFILGGLYAAWSNAWDAMNPDTGASYRQMLTRKLMIIQIGTPFIGLGLIGGMVAVDLLTKRYIRSHYND
jgi:hypothetical protein